MLEKRGRKAAQRALSELSKQGTDRPTTAPSTSNTGAKKRAARQHRTSADRHDTRGNSTALDDADSIAMGSAGEGVSAGDTHDVRADGRGVGRVRPDRSRDGDGDATWLREAEALLAVSSSHDRGY